MDNTNNPLGFQYGITSIINSYLRTGDPIIDIVLLTFVSIMIGNLTNTMTQFIIFFKNMIVILYEYIYNRVKGVENVMTIEYKLKDQDPKVNNKLLIESILYNFNNAKKYRVDNKEVNKNFCNQFDRENDRCLFMQVDERFEEDGIIVEFESLNKKIKKTQNSNNAKQNFNKTEDTSIIEDEIPYLEKITLRSKKPIIDINNFIKRKRDIYIKDFCSKDNNLNIYPVSVYGSSYIEFSEIVYKSNKNFDNWFYPEKEKIKKMVYDFKDKKGVYSIPSIQNKLGILLHGQPGCGKTSFIKALANEMNRNIIPIFLDKFVNIQTLKDIFYNEYIYVRGRYSYGEWKYIPINKRIIVFEEIDTAGTIVMDREKLKVMLNEKKNKSTPFNKYNFYQDMLNEYTNLKVKKKKERHDSRNDLRTNDNICMLNNKEDDSNIDADTPIVGSPIMESSIDDDIFEKSMKHKNGITLGDLLDLLDGICELDGLVYVVTTNHKDYLDPALIRPGRINCDIELTSIKKNEIIEMLTYYYISNSCYESNMSSNEKYTLIVQIADKLDGKLKPSKLEELCRNNNLNELSQLVDTIMTN